MNRLAAALTFFLFSSAALADDGAASGFSATIDSVFGEYLVGPIATVFFWNIPYDMVAEARSQ